MCTVPTNQSVVTVTQSDDNQSRQDDERSQVENNNGLYMCEYVYCGYMEMLKLLYFYIHFAVLMASVYLHTSNFRLVSSKHVRVTSY